jgi:ABC-type branched-subunit amino acid transport system ATPase component
VGTVDCLRVENLLKSFGGITAVNDVTFSVEEGSLLGVIGPNGCGKTTLVNLITGFIKPDSGRIIYRNRDITGLRPSRIANMGLGRTFQMVKPFYRLPAYKNLVIPLGSPRVKKIGAHYGDKDSTALDILEDIGFERDSSVPYRQASVLPHGYLKRLEMARLLALQSDLIIFDELYSGLSLAEVASITPLIKKLISQGKTIIMIEHRLKELFRIADRVVVMDQGGIIAEGDCSTVMRDEQVQKAYLGVELRSRSGRVHGPPDVYHSRRRQRESNERRTSPESLSGSRTAEMMHVHELTVYFENAIAVNELSIHVDTGEIVGVIGPNSAGKSTLMNTMAGLILDTRMREERKGGTRISIFGRITFLGEDITEVWPDERVKRGIVLCRERHPVFRESSVEENLKISGYLRTKAEIRKDQDFIYDLFPRLLERRKSKAGLLSGGEQQMLALGIAFMANPKILLLDEPLLGLSPMLQLHLVEAIEKLNRETGVAIVVAEQFARPLIPILSRGYILENGMLAFEGNNTELFDNPDVRSAYFGIDHDEE